MKKTYLFTMIILLASVGNVYAANKDAEPSALELSDPDYPGGTYDTKIEMQKKVDAIKNLQMTQSQVKTLKDSLLTQEKNSSTPYTTTAKPVTRSLAVKFDAGLTPPVVRLSANMLTTIVFTDGAGNPWDIDTVALNRQLFNDGADIGGGTMNVSNTSTSNTTSNQSNQTTDDSGNLVKNILSIEPLNPVAYGNVIVTLKGLDKPIIMILTTGQNEVDMRVDARISGINPNRKNSSSVGGVGTGRTLSTNVDDSTLLFVDGTPPEEAVRMNVSSHDINAWAFNDEIIVRTNKTIIYPAYKSSVTSSSGMTVYRFDSQNHSITISDNNGQPKTIYIEEE